MSALLPAWWSVALTTSLTLRAVAVPRSFDPDLRMACGVAPILLGLVYRHMGIGFMLAAGHRRGDDEQHNWIQVRGYDVDLTATQYGDEAIARVVPVVSRLYLRTEVGHFEWACGNLRADTAPRIYHPWHPRQHVEVISEALAIIARIPVRRAVREVTATIGGAS